jgi:hypothetical protein
MLLVEVAAKKRAASGAGNNCHRSTDQHFAKHGTACPASDGSDKPVPAPAPLPLMHMFLACQHWGWPERSCRQHRRQHC